MGFVRLLPSGVVHRFSETAVFVGMEQNQHPSYRATTDLVDVGHPGTSSSPAAQPESLMGRAQAWWTKHGGTFNDIATATRDSAAEMGERAKAYTRQEPVRAMALAAMAGMTVSAVMTARAQQTREQNRRHVRSNPDAED
jgi:ElaB/YqjD/DUF883 family membrane-anchored ribosome-binding protein